MNTKNTLAHLKKIGCLRQLNSISSRKNEMVIINNHPYIDFSSNDYLGLSENNTLKQIIKKNILNIPFSATASRLLSGDHDLFHQLESLMASWKQKPACLTFNSGYQANIGILSSLLTKQDVVFADKHIHASIIDGIHLSGAKLIRFKHNDYIHLQKLLKKHRHIYQTALIVTESIFSMDGDIAPIKEYITLKKQFNTLLLIDEAHATGIFGKTGAGIIENLNASKDIDIIVGTYGKALGGFGAYVACDKPLKEHLINTCRSFIFSTALPLPVILWNIQAIKYTKANRSRSKKVLDNTNWLRQALQKYGLITLGDSQIIPIVIGDSKKTNAIAKRLQNEGYWILPIRPPTVPQNQARIRLSITYFHKKKDLKALAKTLCKLN